MRFLKLTSCLSQCSDKDVFIDYTEIKTVYQNISKDTIVETENCRLFVKETPAQVIDMILEREAATPMPGQGWRREIQDTCRAITDDFLKEAAKGRKTREVW